MESAVMTRQRAETEAATRQVVEAEAAKRCDDRHHAMLAALSAAELDQRIEQKLDQSLGGRQIETGHYSAEDLAERIERRGGAVATAEQAIARVRGELAEAAGKRSEAIAALERAYLEPTPGAEEGARAAVAAADQRTAELEGVVANLTRRLSRERAALGHLREEASERSLLAAVDVAKAELDRKVVAAGAHLAALFAAAGKAPAVLQGVVEAETTLRAAQVAAGTGGGALNDSLDLLRGTVRDMLEALVPILDVAKSAKLPYAYETRDRVFALWYQPWKSLGSPFYLAVRAMAEVAATRNGNGHGGPGRGGGRHSKTCRCGRCKASAAESQSLVSAQEGQES